MDSNFLLGFVLAGLIFVAGCGTAPAANVNDGSLSAEVLVPPQEATSNTQEVSTASPGSEPATTTNSEVASKPAALTFDPAKYYIAMLHTTKGDIVIALNFGQTPNTVKNFVDLARKNFYDKTIFHRVMKGFMIQGGDPKGNGTGGPGYQFDDEPFTGEYSRGTVAMANAGPNTNGSQFFIMHADYPLPKNYIIFGHVVKGLEAVDATANSPVVSSASGEPSQPVSPTTITNVDISEE